MNNTPAAVKSAIPSRASTAGRKRNGILSPADNTIASALLYL